MTRTPLRLAAGLLALTVTAACGSGDSDATARSGQDASTYPVTVQNCGTDVTFDRAPSRVMIVNSAPLQYLASLDVLDRLSSRAGKFPPDYYSPETLAAVEEVPSLTDRLNAEGHLDISLESILDQEPDLVLGLPEGVTREALDAAGIPVLIEPSFCPEGIQDPGYDTIYDQMRLYGAVFGKQRAAEQAVTDLEERVDQVEADLPDEQGRTAAVLWPYRGQGTVGAYGGQSMATPQLTTLGFENVFADTDKRVFETSMEELLGRDPDVIILLHTDGTDAEIEQALLDIPGAEDLRAVQTGNVMVQLFNFTEPPTPLVLDGLERIADRFEQE
ncbi:ABC transporter substrate-binding protein [Modestobacter sp. VKM Ac-2979]|uniref:ABC transporter substrate-binding protein n=1 Tax=unclassified Modestobacter TaxID=2643866 RepID=UPI0022AB6D4C|nr:MULTISPECIES: ABC transporter substrate-binding protein [unclassified Modestobacter]MCZ2812014.1 ABC transporter substrate-binding protein [Modestobacter sp. VKM Ac-2979]MCZ2843738.1 ABC transporter substrate-binding protein [Modestobacter sp. VKM Ac-2980]